MDGYFGEKCPHVIRLRQFFHPWIAHHHLFGGRLLDEREKL
jgi:hypothetical protein